jgi:excisionase family DNA binding protein
MTESAGDLLTLAECAKRLKVSRSTVARLIRRRELASVKIGKGRSGPRRVAEGDLLEFVSKNRTESQSAAS